LCLGLAVAGCEEKFKELLFDTLGHGGGQFIHRIGLARLLFRFGAGPRAWSARLGASSYDLLHLSAEKLMRGGATFIIDCDIRPKAKIIRELRTLVATHGYEALHIILKASPDVAIQRWNQRLADGSRHPGHLDDAFRSEFRRLVNSSSFGPIDLPGQTYTFSTDKEDPFPKVEALLSVDR